MRLDWNLSSTHNDSIVIAEKIAKPFESCRLQAYWDVAGFPTNGWGNLLSRTTRQSLLKSGMSKIEVDEWLKTTYPDISQDEADSKFLTNLLKAKASVMRLVKVPIGVNQIAALIDFTFNVGAGNLQSSTLLRCVNRFDFVTATDEFPKWNKAGGKVHRGLTRRRIADQQVFKLDV